MRWVWESGLGKAYQREWDRYYVLLTALFFSASSSSSSYSFDSHNENFLIIIVIRILLM